jgi:antitoxin component YwqK of YwqJK toxin-antitoxin module
MQDRPTAIDMFNCPAPLKLEIGDNYFLKVTFNNGVTKNFDLSPYFEKYKFFAPLKERKLFENAQLDRWAIIWNDDFDIAIEEVYEKGVTIANNH